MSVALLVALLVAQTVSLPVTAEERYVAELRAQIAKGDVEAEVALGNLYESGQSVLPLDPAQAAEWYRRAADKGHAGAQMNLAMMYFDGQGVARNVPQAIAWYEKAAGSGDAVAMLNLGSIYEDGADRVARDLMKAAAWYGKAAGHGLGTAQYRLGMLYRDGRGVTRDRAQAIDWLRKAAERDETDAQLELGILLSPDRATSSDIVEAHMWLNLAASRWKNEGKRVKAGRLRDDLEKAMTEDQRAQAYRRATEWQDAHAWARQSAASK
jgi:TPR repeat protein